jgi:hypothetical protein
MRDIISASRRTDIPAFYLDRLLTWIAAGRATVANPFSGAVSTVDLSPDAVHTIVLWSKQFGKFLERDSAFRPYRLYFLFTLNDMPALEPALPPVFERIGQMRELSARYGPERIAWRFDPIVFRADGPVTGLDRFSDLAGRVAENGVRRLIISFMDFYRKVENRNRSFGLGLIDPPPEEKRGHAAALAELAIQHGFSVESCCEDLDLPGIRRAACIDGGLLAALAGEPARLSKDPGQRKTCRCTVSRDIGSYREMPCPAGCRYCYANPVIPKSPEAGA